MCDSHGRTSPWLLRLLLKHNVLNINKAAARLQADYGSAMQILNSDENADPGVSRFYLDIP